MRWYLVRFRDRGAAYALRTRDLAVRLRNMSGSRLQTVEVIPTRPLNELLVAWDKMAKQAEFEGVLSAGELAVLRAMRTDLQERLNVQ